MDSNNGIDFINKRNLTVFSLDDKESGDCLLLKSKYLSMVKDIISRDKKNFTKSGNDNIQSDHKYVFFWKECDIYAQRHESIFLCEGINLEKANGVELVNFRKLLSPEMINKFATEIKNQLIIEGKEKDIKLLNFDFFIRDEIMFMCAEQFMMFCKAVLFDDLLIAVNIMAYSDPGKIKKLGRKIRGFNDEIWNKNRENVVYTGNMNKYLQNLPLIRELLKTDGKQLVEASPYDKIYGIGLEKEDERALDETKWEGLNLLGKIITRLRDNIIAKI